MTARIMTARMLMRVATAVRIPKRSSVSLASSSHRLPFTFSARSISRSPVVRTYGCSVGTFSACASSTTDSREGESGVWAIAAGAAASTSVAIVNA